MAAPTFKQLEAFWWAANCMNFATAAERLHISVSSLSKRITELEAALGRPVFDRSGLKAVLNADGRLLLPMAAHMLEAMAGLQAGFGTPAEPVGRCRFGVGELSALTWLPAFMARVGQLHPGLQMEPVVDVGSSLETRLADGEFDFAVIAGRSSRQQIQSEALGSAQFVWVARRDLPGLEHGLDAEALARYALVTQPTGAGTRRILDDWLLACRVQHVRRIECNNWMAVAGMLRKGLGVGFLPEGWAGQRGDCLQVLASDPPLAPLPYAFQWRRGDSRSLIGLMQEAVSASLDFSLAPAGR